MEALLRSISRALGGVEVREHEKSVRLLLFDGMEIILETDFGRPHFDRSANFAISYKGAPATEPVSELFLRAVALIKRMDRSPLSGRQRAIGRDGRMVDPSTGALPSRQVPTGLPDRAVAESLWMEFYREAMDLGPFASMHFGYWARGEGEAGPSAPSTDPYTAYTDHLLRYVPENVHRVLDVGCGLGALAARLADRRMDVTALSPEPHHCEMIRAARGGDIEVVCSRFEKFAPDGKYDLLVFSESYNYFSEQPLESFLRYCEGFLQATGYLLIADNLTPSSVSAMEEQKVFDVVEKEDITRNVAPQQQLFSAMRRQCGAFYRLLIRLLEHRDPGLARQAERILMSFPNPDISSHLTGSSYPDQENRRYLIYLLARNRGC